MKVRLEPAAPQETTLVLGEVATPLGPLERREVVEVAAPLELQGRAA